MSRSYVDKTIRCACCGSQEFDIVEDEEEVEDDGKED